MKVGDLVRMKDDWVRHNPWMKGTELDNTPERFGVIVKVPPHHSYWGATAVVEWLDGFSEELTQDKVEVVV
jgi:hypothetical protein